MSGPGRVWPTARDMEVTPSFKKSKNELFLCQFGGFL
jgi:hypothetical protein